MITLCRRISILWVWNVKLISTVRKGSVLVRVYMVTFSVFKFHNVASHSHGATIKLFKILNKPKGHTKFLWPNNFWKRPIFIIRPRKGQVNAFCHICFTIDFCVKPNFLPGGASLQKMKIAGKIFHRQSKSFHKRISISLSMKFVFSTIF